jgi:hypothetical protein
VKKFFIFKKNVNFEAQNSYKLLGRLHILGNSALELKGVERLIFLDSLKSKFNIFFASRFAKITEYVEPTSWLDPHSLTAKKYAYITSNIPT